MIKLLFALLLMMPAASSFATLTTTDLRCDGRVEPLAVDNSTPRLSWRLESDQRADQQTAYQILVGTSPGKSDLWDSGRVHSAESLNVIYQGRPLHSGARACWQVRAWDRTDQPGPYSAPTWWEAAPDEW